MSCSGRQIFFLNQAAPNWKWLGALPTDLILFVSLSPEVTPPPPFFWPCSLQDLSSPPREVTQVPAVKAPSPNHWPQGNSPWMTLLTLPQPCLPLLLSYRTKRILQFIFSFFTLFDSSYLAVVSSNVTLKVILLLLSYFKLLTLSLNHLFF